MIMVPKVLARQMIDIQRRHFDRAFSVADMVQDLMEIWFTLFLEELTWIPADGVRITDQWIKTRKNDRRALKRMVDRTYDSVCAMFAESGTPANAREAFNTFNPQHKGEDNDERKSNP